MKNKTVGKLLSVVISLTVLGGCSTINKDPLESYNRSMYNINSKIDAATLKPIAQGYKSIPYVSEPVHNMFYNLREPIFGVNHLLQGEPKDAGISVLRLGINSTIGILGAFDVASSFGLSGKKNDFGLTLNRWGVKSGPYVVLPLLGPSNPRDIAALGVDYALDPISYVNHIPTRNTMLGVRLVDDRAQILDAEKILKEVALDEYLALRDIYLKSRNKFTPEAAPTYDESDDATEQ